MNKKRLIVGNWKMNPGTLEEAKKIFQKTKILAGKLSNTDVVVCPPTAFLSALMPKKRNINFSLGAQAVSYEEGGSHTGEVGASMLKSLGIHYVIAGHSEERNAGDTDLMVSKRIIAILEEKLTPIVCVGEKVRDQEGVYFNFLKEQIKNSLNDIPKKYANDIIIAYEPVWAIGASEAMNPEQIYEMNLFVKKVFADVFGQESAMKVKVLYGGSVTSRNAVDIIKIGQVDGLLIGRESVNIAGFTELLRAVDVI